MVDDLERAAGYRHDHVVVLVDVVSNGVAVLKRPGGHSHGFGVEVGGRLGWHSRVEYGAWNAATSPSARFGKRNRAEDAGVVTERGCDQVVVDVSSQQRVVQIPGQELAQPVPDHR